MRFSCRDRGVTADYRSGRELPVRAGSTLGGSKSRWWTVHHAQNTPYRRAARWPISRRRVRGWKVLSEREREIVIGTDENAPVGICFMPVTDPETVKNRVHLDLTSSAAGRDGEIDRLLVLGGRRVDAGQTCA